MTSVSPDSSVEDECPLTPPRRHSVVIVPSEKDSSRSDSIATKNIATPKRHRFKKFLNIETPYIVNVSKNAPRKVAPACCTMSIGVVFAFACIFIAVVFTINTAIPVILFKQQTEASIKSVLSLGLEGMMRQVTDPLSQTVEFADQMRTMTLNAPKSYNCDDASYGSTFPGNASNADFFYQVSMYARKRSYIGYVYQTIFSTRFYNVGGSPIITMCLLDASSKQAYIFANNTGIHHQYNKSSEIKPSNLVAQSIASMFSFNLSGVLVSPNNPRWVSAVVPSFGQTIVGPIPTKYTYTVPLQDPDTPGLKWGLGIDHQMMSLQNVLLQGTPPVSVGDDTVVPSQFEGSHTTLYDMNSNILMSSTHAGVPSVKDNVNLWTAGESPEGEVNEAFRRALDVCPYYELCKNAVVDIGSNDIRSVYRVLSNETHLNLLVVSSVPRHHFFAESDRAFGITVGLACGCTALLALGCIWLLVLIYRPLSSLKMNMFEAAELHNDRVTHTATYLREIAGVSAVFDQMNKQLLVARSFVPEAVLLGRSEEDTEGEGDESDVDNEGSVVETVSVFQSVRLRNALAVKSNSCRGSLTTGNTSDTSGTGAIAKLFAVNEKRVAVLSLNMVGFHGICESARPSVRANNIREVVTTLLEMAVGCAHAERGVMDSFHGDHFILTFNASRVVAGPLAAAVRTANAFIRSVEQEEDGLFAGGWGLAAGAASGRAHVGTFGIDGYRRLSVVGEAFRQATTLQQSAVQFLRLNGTSSGMSRKKGPLRSGCLVEERSLKELANSAFHAQAVGCIQGSQHRASSSNKMPPIVYFVHVAAAAPSNAVNEGEWLYELHALEASNPYLEPNRAMIALLEGNVEQCRSLLFDARGGGGSQCLEGSRESPSVDDTLNEDTPSWAVVSRHLSTYTAEQNSIERSDNAVGMSSKRVALPWVAFHQ